MMRMHTLPTGQEGISCSATQTAAASSRSAVLQQSASVLLAQVAMLLCGVLNSFLVAYVVGPPGRGLIYLLQLISGGIGLTFLNLGLGPASVVYLGHEGNRALAEVATGVFWASLFLGALPVLVLVPGWHWIAPLVTPKISGAYVWLALAVIPVINLTFNVGFVCLGQKRIGTYNWLRVSPSVLFSLSLLVVLLSRSHTIGVVALAWAATMVMPGLLALEVVRSAGGMCWQAGTQKFLRTALRFGWHSHLGSVTQYLQHRCDILLVSYFFPLQQLGLYAFAVSLAELLWYVPQAVGTVLLPHVAANAEGNASFITPFVCRTTLALTAVLSVGLAVATAWLVPRVLPAFTTSVHVFWILIPGVVAASIFKVLASDFNGRGRPIETFYPALISLGMVLACGIVVIPRFGIDGAAFVTTAGYALNSFLYVRSYSRMMAVPVVSLLFLRFEDLALARNLMEGWNDRTAENASL